MLPVIPTLNDNNFNTGVQKYPWQAQIDLAGVFDKISGVQRESQEHLAPRSARPLKNISGVLLGASGAYKLSWKIVLGVSSHTIQSGK